MVTITFDGKSNQIYTPEWEIIGGNPDELDCMLEAFVGERIEMGEGAGMWWE